MIILQTTSTFRMSCRKGILYDKHKDCKMYILDIAFFTFCLVPNKDSDLFWTVIDKVAGEKEWLINNHRKVTLAVKNAEKYSEERLTKIFNSENKSLRERNESLYNENNKLNNDIRCLKKAINIVKGDGL